MGVLSPPSPAVSARVTARVTRPRLPFWAPTGLQPLTSTDMSLSFINFFFLVFGSLRAPNTLP